MARLLLTHIVGAPDLEPEVSHMTFAANAWVLEARENCQWLIEAPDVHAFRVCMLPGWTVAFAPHEDGESEEPEYAMLDEFPHQQGGLF